MTPAAQRTSPRFLGLLVFLAPFSLYLRTMAPTVYGLDSAELTVGACTLGIVHSPGAPLFLLVARLFCFLPLGDYGWRVNLVSATAGSLTAFFVYALLRRLTGRAWVGVATAWLLAASYYVWVWAVVAELYAPHMCFVAGLLWLAVRWRDTHQPALLWLMGLVAGLGMGNHTALVLTAPGLFWLIWTGDPDVRKRPWRLVGPTVVFFWAFAAIFLYLPIRHAAGPAVDFVRDYFPDINLLSLRGWMWMIRGGMFESLFFSVPPREIPHHLLRLVVQILANFGVVPIAIALWGLVRSLRGPRACRDASIASLLLLCCHSGFFLLYGALDTSWMHSVSYLAVALFFGMGLASLSQYAALTTPLTALLLWRQVWFNYPFVDLSNDWSARRLGERIMNVMPAGALFIGLWEHTPILEYLRLVEGWRPDTQIVNAVFLGPVGAQELAAQAYRTGQPVFTTATNLFSEAFTFELVPEGFCYRLTAWSGMSPAEHGPTPGKTTNPALMKQ